MNGTWVDKPSKEVVSGQPANGDSAGAWVVPTAASSQEQEDGTRKKAKKPYRPDYRTAGWGLIIALHKAGAWGENFMLRSALIEKA